jgi:gamma-glutamyltranspeptidase/glutathione hydrolase
MDQFDVAGLAVNGVDSQQIEGDKSVCRRQFLIAEPSSMAVTPEQMLDDNYHLASRAKLIDEKKHRTLARTAVKAARFTCPPRTRSGM